jgi:hypothetical protein
VGQVSDPYEDEDDEEVQVTVADLPDDPADGEEPTTPDGRALAVDTDYDELTDDVTFDLSDWGGPEHEAVTRRLIEDGVRHHWDDHKLVVPSVDAERAQQVVDEIGGVGEALDESRDQVAYDLDEWDDDRLVTLGDALDEAGVPFEWDGQELFVYEEDEQQVDEIIDGVAHPHEIDAESDDEDGGGELMGELFVVADRLQNDPDSHEAAVTLLDLSRVAEKAPAPYGLAPKEWERIQGLVEDLSRTIQDTEIDENTVAAAARDLRGALRNYV